MMPPTVDKNICEETSSSAAPTRSPADHHPRESNWLGVQILRFPASHGSTLQIIHSFWIFRKTPSILDTPIY